MNTCRNCKYFNGEPVGLWFVTKKGTLLRRRCTHPKHFNQPKNNTRKACKYFEERFFDSVIVEDNEWIDVKERLPEKDVHVLCAIEYIDGDIGVTVRWRTIFEDAVADDNGFAIYPIENKVLAWMPIPEYKPNKV